MEEVLYKMNLLQEITNKCSKIPQKYTIQTVWTDVGGLWYAYKILKQLKQTFIHFVASECLVCIQMLSKMIFVPDNNILPFHDVCYINYYLS